jgi:hypothetical protein
MIASPQQPQLTDFVGWVNEGNQHRLFAQHLPMYAIAGNVSGLTANPLLQCSSIKSKSAFSSSTRTIASALPKSTLRSSKDAL